MLLRLYLQVVKATRHHWVIILSVSYLQMLKGKPNEIQKMIQKDQHRLILQQSWTTMLHDFMRVDFTFSTEY